jgi:hypothetical protein
MVPPKKTLFPGKLPLSEHFSLIPYGINKNILLLFATLYEKIGHFTMERCVQHIYKTAW